MGSTVFAEKVKAGGYRLYNSTGVALVKGEFTVLEGKSLVAAEAIGIAGTGTLEDALGQVIQIADYESSYGTFAAANLPVYWDPSAKVFSNRAVVGYYLIGYTLAAKSGTVTKVLVLDALVIPSDYATLAAALAVEVAARENVMSLAGVRIFRTTVTLTAAAAGTAVHIVAAADVGALEKVFIMDFLLSVGGATAWSDSTGTIVTLQDTAGSPVVAATFAKAQLTGNAQLGKHSTGVTLGTPIRTGVGLTADKGLDIIADSNFDAGSDISITVWGFIATA
jgi:hypothetical protein